MKMKIKEYVLNKVLPYLIKLCDGGKGLPLPVYAAISGVVSRWNVEVVLFREARAGMHEVLLFDLPKHPFYPGCEGQLHLPGAFPGNKNEGADNVLQRIVRKYGLPDTLFSQEKHRLWRTVYRESTLPGPTQSLIAVKWLTAEEAEKIQGNWYWVVTEYDSAAESYILRVCTTNGKEMFLDHEYIIHVAQRMLSVG